MRVKRRLPILVLGLTLLPVLIITLVMVQMTATVTRGIFDRQIDSISTSVAKQFEDFFRTESESVVQYARIPAYREYLLAQRDGTMDARMQRQMNTLIDQQTVNQNVQNVTVCDATGTAMLSTDPTKVGTNMQHDDAFEAAKRQGGSYAGFVAQWGGDHTILVSAPIHDEAGNFLGMFCRELSMNYINQNVHNARIGDTGYLYVLAKDGQTISNYYQQRVGKVPADRLGMEQLRNILKHLQNGTLTQDTGTFEYTLNGEHILANYQTLPMFDWLVISAVNYNEVYDLTARVASMLLIVAIVSVAGALFVGMRQAARITKPLAYISDKVTRIAAGELSPTREYRGKDEFKTLFTNIDRMVQKIDENNKLLSYQANCDQMTGIYNRKYMDELIDGQLGCHAHQAFALLDLNRFKDVNDSLGHLAGDDILKKTAQVLKEVQSERVIVSRMGGDEFLVFFAAYENKEEVHAVIERIYDGIAAIRDIYGNDPHITASIGLVFCPQEMEGKHILLKAADDAMYVHKQSCKRGETGKCKEAQV